MALQMTRAEYEAKYGAPPPVGGGSALGTSLISKQQKPTSNKIADFFGAKGITDLAGAAIAKSKAPAEQKGFVEFPTKRAVLGSAIQTGANFLPGVGVGAKLGTKVATGLATGYAFDVGSKLQDKDKTVGQSLTPGIGTAVGGALPVGGAVVGASSKIVGRLLKGLGSGLSGVSTETIENIVKNPKIAQQATEKLAQNGNAKVLEENAKTIVNGIANVRKQARGSYGEAMQQLKKEDIDPKKFRAGIQPVLDKFGVSSKGKERLFDKVEFSDQKNLNKASKIIDKLSESDLDGLSVRRLIDTIEDSKYKTTGSDVERLSFNAFLKDLGEGISNAVNQSTDKLQEANKAFSGDMQLVETVQNIFGKVNFKNLPEVVKASQKLESLFAQKGLAPEVVDDFLKRIGISPDDFRTGEAVRQISNKSTGANTKGLSIGEITQGITSSIITPQMVRDISTATGLGKDKMGPFIQSLQLMKPAVRSVILNSLLQSRE